MPKTFALRAQCRQDVCAPSETWRVFCAIELPLDVRLRLMDHIAHLQASAGNARASWNRIDNLHLTLKFLGEIPDNRIEALSLAAGRAARSVTPFQIRLNGCGSFPPRGAPRVLWIGIEDPEEGLGKLYRALEAECHAAGFPRERRPFHAHITAARVRRADESAQGLARLHRELSFESSPFTVDALQVMRSILESRGSRYHTLAHCQLGSGALEGAGDTREPPVK